MLPRKAVYFLLSVFIFLLAGSGFAHPGEPVAVIVNKDNRVESLSDNDIRKIYTNTVLNWPGGVPIIIYDLSVQSQLRGVFSMTILGKQPDRAAEEWAHLKITNQAKNPPVTVKSEALIIRRVSTEPGAIGYVSLNAVKNNPDVKIVHIIQ